MLMRGPGMCVLTMEVYHGHLYRPSEPTKLPLGVGVLTMFWTISSNKSQPKLLVSVSVAKWQTVHPPKPLPPNRLWEHNSSSTMLSTRLQYLTVLLWLFKCSVIFNVYITKRIVYTLILIFRRKFKSFTRKMGAYLKSGHSVYMMKKMHPLYRHA